MPVESQSQVEREQRRLAGLLGSLAEQETVRLHNGTLPWSWWLERAAAYGQYGFANTLMIAAQYRFASDVRSYDQWRTQGRHVRKGEQGIRIISRTGRPRAVFDLAQTDGLPLPERMTPRAGEVFADLRLLAVDSALFVYRHEVRYTSRRATSIDPGLETVRALAHQVGHLLLHHGPDNVQACHGIRRVEADSIAYLLLARLGLDTCGPSFPAVADWAGDDPLSTIALVGDRILRTATRIRKRLAVAELSSATWRTEPASLSMSGARPASASTTTSGRGRTNAHVPTRADLIAMHSAAHSFFRARLPGSWVPAYLTGRGFDPVVQQHWEVGFAAKTWRGLTDHLRDLGYPDDAIVASGLARRGRTTLFDTFRDRAMLPLRDPDGIIAGFIGRLPDNADGPKYLNSPETPIFRKGELLFGLYETRDRLAHGARPVIVEGPLDAVAINTASPHHAAISPCGNTLTARQLTALSRFADLTTTGLLLALDGDQSGQDAAVRAWNVLSRVTGPVGALRLPGNQDPADVLTRRGRMAVREELQAETPLANLVIDAAMERHSEHLEFAEGKLAAARDAAVIIARLSPDQVARHVARVAAILGIGHTIITDVVTDAVAPERP